MLRVSLAVRFILFTSLLVLATSLSLGVFAVFHITRDHDEQVRQQGISLVRNFAHNAELGVLTRNSDLLGELGGGLFQVNEVIAVAVVDGDGIPLLDERRGERTRRDLKAMPEFSSVLAGANEVKIVPFAERESSTTAAYEFSYPIVTRRDDTANEEIGFLLDQNRGEGGKIEVIGQARVMISLATAHRTIAQLEWALGLLTSLVIAVAVLFTVMLVHRMVAPLRVLAAATVRIANGSLDETVPAGGSDEIGQLARSFNQMTTELKRSRRDLEMYSADLENQVRLRTRELEEAQNQLVQAEKMSAVGLLVSGVAHELNNPLAGVVGYSQLLLKAETDDRVHRGLEKIAREAERCKKIVQNLQTFARKHAPQKDYVGVNGILESTLELRSYQFKVDNIDVVLDLDPDLPKTMADFHQLQQVFLNIIINAHQAITSRGHGGRLTLRSRREGDEIVVEFQDDGPGMPPDVVGRIFDPFFTTKEVGQGTGLGLSICYGIIQEHHGSISARNAPEGGAIFRVELPVIEQEANDGADEKPEETKGVPPTPGRNILVVDDELAIIDILYQVLRAEGHRVDTALNGTVALKKIQKERYDLIISDLKMPGMGGKELFEKIREIDLDLARRVIFSTGDVVSLDTREFLQKSGNNFLQKPFEIETIRQVVQSVLVTTAS